MERGWGYRERKEGEDKCEPTKHQENNNIKINKLQKFINSQTQENENATYPENWILSTTPHHKPYYSNTCRTSGIYMYMYPT